MLAISYDLAKGEAGNRSLNDVSHITHGVTSAVILLNNGMECLSDLTIKVHATVSVMIVLIKETSDSLGVHMLRIIL